PWQEQIGDEVIALVVLNRVTDDAEIDRSVAGAGGNRNDVFGAATAGYRGDTRDRRSAHAAADERELACIDAGDGFRERHLIVDDAALGDGRRVGPRDAQHDWGWCVDDA